MKSILHKKAKIPIQCSGDFFMKEILNILLIGIALSMDTFSLSLGVGTYNLEKKKCIQLSLLVGIMHFIMPLLGNIVGDQIMRFFSLNSNLFLGCILLFIAVNLLIDMVKKEEDTTIDLSLFGMFLFAFGVSIDAFSTGLALTAITKNKILAMLLFSRTSFTFTLIGLNIGKYVSKKLGNKASILGFILLVVLGIFHICK